MTDLIQLKDLRRQINNRLILAIPEWRLAKMRHCLVLGPSGSGKTTLLHILAGLTVSFSGSIQVLGADPRALSPTKRDRFRGRHIGLIFQRLHLLESLTARENLVLAHWSAGLKPDPLQIDKLLDRLGLIGRAQARPSQLSQGEAQRLAIARALMNRPALILADEPTSALDDRNAALVCSLLLEQCALEKATLIMATHDKRVLDQFDHRLELEDRA